jgi:nucleotide-binding universal stress UspA family protein
MSLNNVKGDPAASNAPQGTTPPMPFARLLVPVDYSATSRAAFSVAMQIAEKHGSEVILFHAAEFSDGDEFLNSLGAPWGRSDATDEVRQGLKEFAETVRPGSGARVGVDATREDDAVRAIVGAVERHGSTLVVLGAHERTHVLRSTAERIAHALSCSVLLVRGS